MEIAKLYTFVKSVSKRTTFGTNNLCKGLSKGCLKVV